MILNFKKLLELYPIQIPIIQRDYVQGRNTKKIERIRTQFLNDIKKVFDGDVLHLDFVYGFIKNDEFKNAEFIPLDGQQRLTTLFLLHWYFDAKSENTLFTSILKKFTYKTHKYVEAFIQFIITEKIKITKDFNSDLITERINFVDKWKHEPSIKNMLVMLADIHNVFFEYPSGESLNNITFSLLDMGKNNLSDDLYIKMNSRGKQLTDFDNFKAQFEKILEHNEDQQKSFEYSIDGKWIDLFWQYRGDNEYTIDNQFMRFFWIITEILYFKFIGTKENEKNPFIHTWENDSIPLIDYELINKVYTHKDAINTLFKVLDKATELGKEKIAQVFDNIFCEKDEFEKYTTHLSIFDTNIDLFNYVCIQGRFGQKWLLLLYAVIYSEFDIHIEKIRVIRNLVLSDLMRPRDFNNQIRTLESIINNSQNHNIVSESSGFHSELIQEENNKIQILNTKPQLKELIWKLENNPFLNTMIQMFNPYLKSDNLTKIEKSFTYYFQKYADGQKNVSDLLRRAILTQGDYAIYDGGSTHIDGWESRWHLCDIDSTWMNLFTTFGSKNLSLKDAIEKRKPLLKLLELIQDTKDKTQSDKILQDIIDKYNDKENVYYTMIKNPEVLKYSCNKRFMLKDSENKITNILKKKTYQNQNYRPYGKF